MNKLNYSEVKQDKSGNNRFVVFAASFFLFFVHFFRCEADYPLLIQYPLDLFPVWVFFLRLVLQFFGLKYFELSFYLICGLSSILTNILGSWHAPERGSSSHLLATNRITSVYSPYKKLNNICVPCVAGTSLIDMENSVLGYIGYQSIVSTNHDGNPRKQTEIVGVCRSISIFTFCEVGKSIRSRLK